MTTVVWLRRDLRLADNPALAAAADRGAVVPVYVWAPEEEDGWPPGGASKWWLQQSLASLSADLEKAGSPLILRQGKSADELEKIVAETGADAVHWNRRYEAHAVERDKRIKKELRDAGLEVRSFNGFLLWEPWEIETQRRRPVQGLHALLQGLPRHARACAADRGAREAHAAEKDAAVREDRSLRARAEDRLGRRPSRRVDARRGRRAGSSE